MLCYVLFCSVLFCSVLLCYDMRVPLVPVSVAVPLLGGRTASYRTKPYRTMLYRTTLCYTVPHHAVPYHTCCVELYLQCLSSLAMESLSKPEHEALLFRLRAARYVVQAGVDADTLSYNGKIT